MKKQRIPLQPQQLSFSFEINTEPMVVTEVKINSKVPGQTHDFSKNVINFSKAVIARKTNKESEMYLRILDSVKHIA